MEHRYRFKLIIEPCEEGGFYGRCPALEGCFVQGETVEETLSELKAAVDTHIEIRLERGEPIPADDTIVEEYETAVAA
jgi:predicted RNase H-like HicB family nuclease